MIDEKPLLDQALLEHHGIKGMRWGQRKAPETSGPRVIKKGTEFQTVTAGGKVDTSRRVFSSYTAKDNLAYRGNYARILSVRLDEKDIRVNLYKAKKDIKVAGDADVAKVFQDLYKKDPKGVYRAIAESYELSYRTMMTGSKVADTKMIDMLASDYSKKGEKWINSTGHEVFKIGAGQVRSSHSTFDDYYTMVAKRGFDAMVDTTDRRAKLSDDPIILLTPKTSVGAVKQIPLTKDDIQLARAAYKQKKKEIKKTGINGVIQ